MSRPQTRSKARRAAWLLAAALPVATLAATAIASPWAGDAEVHAPAEQPAARIDGQAREGSPLAKLEAPADDALGEGVVVERLAAGPYSYLRVASEGAPDVWVATLGAGATVGARVALRSFGARRDFVSKRLGRTFARVEFALVSVMDDLEEDSMNDVVKGSVGLWMLACGVVGCGDDAAEGSGGGVNEVGSGGAPGATTGAATNASASGGGGDACARGVLEPDLVGQNADGSPAPVVWLGPGADPDTGELLPAEGTYVASATYLTLESSGEAQARFGQLMEPILGELFANPDVVAIQLGTSASCGTARTFTVWRSLEGMMRFVAGDAHAAAVGAVGEVSRGGSVVTHWEGATIDSLDWDEATARLAATEGPMY